jgi:probable RNA-binding protein EIF1AD
LESKSDSYAKVIETRGKGQFLVSLPDSTQVLVYMPPKFRNALWIRRGSYIIIRQYPEAQQSSGSNELLHVLSGEQVKEIKKEGGWPEEFKTDFGVVESDDPEEEKDDIESEYEY